MALSLTIIPNTFAMSALIADGYPKTRATMDSGSAECLYTELPWLAIETYPEGLLGWVSSSSATNVVLHMPHACPNWLDMLCTEIAFEPTGAATGHNVPNQAVYDYASIMARYETAPDEPLELLVSERLTPAIEFLTLPNKRPTDELSALTWDGNPWAVPARDTEAPARMIMLQQWEYTITRLPEACLPANLGAHHGKVNSAVMVSHSIKEAGAAKTFAAETVLFGDYVLEDGMSWWGERYYTITYKFLVRPDGWNRFYRSGVVAPQQLYVRGAGAFNPYVLADLNDLIFEA